MTIVPAKHFDQHIVALANQKIKNWLRTIGNEKQLTTGRLPQKSAGRSGLLATSFL
jgi:hypothetical protein